MKYDLQIFTNNEIGPGFRNLSETDLVDLIGGECPVVADLLRYVQINGAARLRRHEGSDLVQYDVFRGRWS